MNWVKHLHTFLIPTKKADTGGHDANNLLKQGRTRHQTRQNKSRNDEGPPNVRRRSLFRPISSTFKKNKSKDLPDLPTQGEKPAKSPRDETLQQLLHEIGRLSDYNTRLRGEVGAKEAELGNLRNRDGESGWKDGLYEQRVKEHASAQVSIYTGSASGDDILQLVAQLNNHIAAIATLATTTPAKDPRRGGPESIRELLGEKLPISFSQSDNCLEGGLARALLQIFLVHYCKTFIHSWCLENREFDETFTQFYDRISKKEEQRVAGKWRQITLGQLPHGFDLNSIQTEVVAKLMEIASCAGWRGGAEGISVRVDALLKSADTIRKIVKEDIIAADIEPWAAVPGTKFDSKNMKNVGDDFALQQVAEPMRCTVLGCTGLGVTTRLAAGEAAAGIRNWHSRARVVLVESLGVGQSYASRL